ncbi:MAG: methionyl-tRNA formyltransferase [candidate division WOR-3 bacterium]
MRIAFFGSGEFGLPTLFALKESHHKIALVVTAPPKPSGRGRRLTTTPVAHAALELGLETLAPEDPNSQEFLQQFQNYAPQCGVVIDYGYILKEPLLKIPQHGFINLHPSLLPRYRGAAPIPRQIMDGCTKTGLTVFALDTGVDTGDILNQIEIPIQPDETCGELKTRLGQIGAQLVVKTLNQIETGSVKRQEQNHALATKAPKLTKSDRVIVWNKPAQEIHNLIRALSPEPGAITSFRGRQLTVLRSRVLNEYINSDPGTIITEKSGVMVATTHGLLELLQIKPAGGKVLSGADFRNGYRPSPGERLGDNQ